MRATGVDIIDHVVGGIAPGLPMVLAGPSGSGLTVLALQITSAAIENGEVVTYLCNDPAPFLLQQASTLGFDLEPAVASGQLALLDLDPSVGASVRMHGTEALVKAAKAEEPLASLLVVDPFTALTSEIMEDAELRGSVRAFVKAASPAKMVLTLEAEQMGLQKGIDRVLSEVCGAFLSLHREDSGRRQIRVEKTRSGLADAEFADFEIGKGGSRRIEHAAATAPTLLPDDLAPGSVVAATTAPPSLLAEAKGLPKILIVDDDRLTREMLAKWLEPEYQVQTARDGFEAMTCISTQRPDLMVLDLIMPRVTGYELLAAIQRMSDPIPTLVSSSRLGRPADRIGPMVLGATDMLTKPVDRFEFMHKVEVLLRLEGQAPRMMDPEEAEALFANVSPSRLLEPDEFAQRLERAARFGDRYGLPSCLVSVATPSSAQMDTFTEIVDGGLRFEDAMLRVSPKQALLLFLAIEPADAPPVLDRLCKRFEAEGGDPERLETGVHAAACSGSDPDWSGLFKAGAGGATS